MEAKFSSSISSAFSVSILLLLLLISATPTTARPSTAAYKKYIKTMCNSTTYPSLCYKSLSPYYSVVNFNPYNLCYVSISVSSKIAKNCSALITTLSKQKGLTPDDSAVLYDCAEEIKESVDEFRQSLKDMKDVEGSEDREFRMANVRTWVSAAMTDEYTCLDEMEEKKVSKMVKKKISKCVGNMVQHTSNLLALMKNIY